jgi:dolichyl-phosphate-mannose-protein mannosyltransferase
VEDSTKNLPFDDYLLVIGLTIIAAIVRLYKIDYPTSVVFDEVHFGGFATKYDAYHSQEINPRYIKGKFFMDVHPPLAKMLIAATGWLAGFQGDFDFKEIGK